VSEDNETPAFSYDDGRWYLLSMGAFIQVLVDTGGDPAVAMRVLENGQPDENGDFVRRMEVVQIPNGHVLEVYRRLPCAAAERVIRERLKKGVVK
jgi:hypothetical protein